MVPYQRYPILILSISKRKILKTITILVYTNLVLVDIGRF